jgi:hypothetical protein
LDGKTTDELEGIWKELVVTNREGMKIRGVLEEIRTDHLPNTKPRSSVFRLLTAVTEITSRPDSVFSLTP